MPLTQQQCTSAIAEHSAGFADAATGNLDADVEFCPGWTVRDVVHHLTRVHWFWATIVEENLTDRPDHLEDPDKASDDSAIEVFRAGADRLVRVLRAADPTAPVWTWAPAQQDAGFVIRHQVQEAVGHHWDVARAAGRGIQISPQVGADSVDEFLHFSVSNASNVEEPPPPALEGRLGFACTDSDAAWLVADADPAGAVSVTQTTRAALDAEGVPTVVGTGGQLLLWLYNRHGDPAGDANADGVEPVLQQRFRRLCYTG